MREIEKINAERAILHQVEAGGTLMTSRETSEVRFVSPESLDTLQVYPSMRLRIDHHLEGRPKPHIG
jgi:hypothetical protein